MSCNELKGFIHFFIFGIMIIGTLALCARINSLILDSFTMSVQFEFLIVLVIGSIATILILAFCLLLEKNIDMKI